MHYYITHFCAVRMVRILSCSHRGFMTNHHTPSGNKSNPGNPDHLGHIDGSGTTVNLGITAAQPATLPEP